VPSFSDQTEPTLDVFLVLGHVFLDLTRLKCACYFHDIPSSAWFAEQGSDAF